MSSKQMARAAVNGSRLSFRFGPDDTLHGYLVGMDDFHWFVAEVIHPANGGEPTIETHLVHKGSAARVRFHRNAFLTDEDQAIQAEVQSIGGAFFTFCGNLLSRKTPEQQK